MRFAILVATLVALTAPTAEAAVTGVGPSGFQVQMVIKVAAPAAKVWEAVLTPGKWWNPEHSYSSNGANMTITPVAGGCWCERWPGGQVLHMTVVQAIPTKTLRLAGGLGPLQSMGVSGALTRTLTTTTDGSTDVTLEYSVGGFSPRGFDGLSRAVDGVLAEQMNRLVLYVQTGNPNARATE